ncbi:hypothetical protein [Streptomyces cucumeris]|uniref:hypothetical protein n=1 Tax=Streptomyces cucumeris TaxID=2962890 RepID=UPI0020C8F443|nr:hypothetical protein [Streptomyces sp. NEAU-Y11]MCP9211421.1 hypothetical protein [Streptomyces sp. NEAU-Y11]
MLHREFLAAHHAELLSRAAQRRLAHEAKQAARAAKAERAAKAARTDADRRKQYRRAA